MAEFILLGRLTRNPEKKTWGDSGSNVHFGVAENVMRRKKREPVYWDVTVWGDYGNICLEQLHKGDGVLVIGEITNRVVEKDGLKRTYIDINARRVEFLSKYGAKGEGRSEEASEAKKETDAADVGDDFTAENMPF